MKQQYNNIGNKDRFILLYDEIGKESRYILKFNLINESTSEDKDYNELYLTFEALEDGTFTFTNQLEYSIDSGTTWTQLEANTATPTVMAGDKVLFRATLSPSPSTEKGVGSFSSTGMFNASGNPLSLLYGDNFADVTDISEKPYALCRLFSSNTNLISASRLALPATTLASYCYQNMFSSCTGLTLAPELPATTLANGCYKRMFYNCTSLMTAPELPATTLTNSCYCNMFQDCTSLTTAPVLPATTLESYCYTLMFYRCTNLNYIKAMFTTTPENVYTENWVNSVASTGTFVKNSAATWDKTGTNGIPTGWTVQTVD